MSALATAAVLVAAGALGCGAVVEFREEVDYLPDGDRSIAASGGSDCDAAAGFALDAYLADEPARPELHIIGIGRVPRGEASIRVARRGPAVLILSTYDQTRWRVELEPGAVVQQIIATGYRPQAVTAPEGIRVLTIDAQTADGPIGPVVTWPSQAERDGDCGDFFPPDECNALGVTWHYQVQRQIEDLVEYVAWAERETGLSLTTFHGCGRMSAFRLVDSHLRAN